MLRTWRQAGLTNITGRNHDSPLFLVINSNSIGRDRKGDAEGRATVLFFLLIGYKRVSTIFSRSAKQSEREVNYYRLF